MNDRERKALAALESRDWSAAEPAPATNRAKAVLSIRLSPDVIEALAVEAAHRGVKPGTLASELIEAGLQPAPEGDAVVPLVELRKWLERHARHAA